MSEAQIVEGGSVDQSDSSPQESPDADVTLAPTAENGDPPQEHDTLWDLYGSSGKQFTDEEKKAAFTNIADTVKKYSDELVERWGKEIDTYLVYAGLFSAILTAFNVESYKLLQPDPGPDQSSAILQHISLQLGSLSFVQPFINSTHPAFRSSGATLITSTAIPRWAVSLNICWFTSLVLSLSSASVGILVKQWLNEFKSGLSVDSEHISKLRQYRLNNLERWHVGSIVNAIPVLLQSALALFFSGLLVLLWHLHRAVAGVTSVFVLGITVFIIGTTITPLIATHCPYLSSQSLGLYALRRYVRHTHKKGTAGWSWLLKMLRRGVSTQDLGGAQNPSSPVNFRQPSHWQPWVAREHDIVEISSLRLEMDVFSTAYKATWESDIIASATARIIDWVDDDAREWFDRLVKIDTFHFGEFQEHFTLHLFGRIMDGGELPEAYNDILMRSMEKYTSLALRTLRGKDYSKDKPLKNLGVYMRAHAILLHVFTIRSLQDATGSGTRSASLEGDVKTGLLSLSATLDLLADAFAARDVEDRIGSVEEDIIRPISHIVHAISHQFSPLRSLLPPDFCINLQKFISAFRKSAFSDRKFWIYVPWKEEEWKPLDLCATAQKLSKKLSSTVVSCANPRPSEAHENDSLDASSSYHTAHQSETVSEPPSPTVRAPLEDAHLTFDTAKHEEHPDRSEGDPWTYPDDGMLLPVPRESYQF
ncbi:hypothetical protein ONZ51_g11837 [Trametes cubensis]|uniref:DUF6535 domain-containing protein n=1 Tax=Trametes cubensis TaxID=1111947 RepID=A0AAD7X544_9APHY|nr:hypothetical protein ONZ51_g11837 [Trametes cubensis]